MATTTTHHSQLSQTTNQVLKEVGSKSTLKLLQSQNPEVNDQVVHQAWDQFGRYIASQMRAGRGVIVPKFGSFTFTAPNVNLGGVTNPKQRDFQRRMPVFIISPNFYQGGNLKPGAFCKEFGHIRPYDNKGVSGNMHLAKCNFTEVGILAGLNKETARVAIERVLKDLAAKVRTSGRVEMALPGVGVINIWDGVAAVAFDDALVGQTIQSTNKNYSTVARKELAQTYLTTGTMEKFFLQEQGYDTQKYEGRYMGVNEGAKDYLEKRLNISANNFRIGESFRPLSAAINYDSLSVSYNRSKRMMSTRPKGRDPFANPNYRSTSVLAGLDGHNGRANIGAGPNFTSSNFSHIQNPLSIRYGELIKPTAQKISETRVKSIVKKRIGVWMREHSLLPIDAFFKILSKELGENTSRNVKVDRDLFARCLLLLDIGIDEKSAQSYGADLADKDGKIDAEAFINNISSEDKDDLNHIRDIIHLNGLKFEDILKTMDIPREQAELDLFKISKGINRIDPKMAKSKADQIAHKILNGREVITTYDLVEALEGISKADIQQDIESNANVLRKIRIKLLDSDNPNMLKEEFEKMDEKNNGQIDSANFKTCLLKLRKSLDLTIGEINRIARYESKSKGGHIDYNKFLESLDKEIITLTLKDANAYNEDSLFSLKQLKDIFKDYLARHKLTPLKFLAGLQANSSGANFSDQELKLQRLEIPIEVFRQFLLEKVIKVKGVRPETLNYYIHKIDIDRDGIVDGQDLEAFLTRAHLIEDTKLRMVTTVRDVTGEDYQPKVLKDHNLERFFPVAPLPKSRVDSVLRALRTAIANRNLSFREFFTKLDENKDGMISYDEFSAGIKSVVDFSKETIKGLFAYMDRTQIGMIDFNNFLKVMKKSVLDNLEEKAEDNFEWQIDIIKQIQQWYFQSNLTSEDAFRMVDIDYDQCISKNDLRVFLKSILFIPIEEITSVRLDRLFNLIDQYKKGTIGYEDFRRILTENFTPTDNLSLTGGVSLNKHSFDWRLNARQKMGLYISKKYKDLEQSFEEISNHGARITFEQFSQWIFSHSVLDGFNLTEKLLRDLFSDFDPHKKGHLTKADWKSVFSPYNHYMIKLHEITDIISSQFCSVKDAFQYFCSYGPSNQTVYEPGFHEALENLFPKRFTDVDKKSIWNMVNYHGAIGRLHFNKLFNSSEFNGSLSLTGTTTRPQTVGPSSYTSKFAAIEPEKSDVISLLRDYLKCTPKQLEQVFDEIDITKCGKVTNLEFKEGIRKLNTGLSALEIDELINATPMGNDGKINYKDFIKRMKETTADVRIQDRTRQRLHAIKDQIYIYLLTPKDAFRQFNSDRTGKLTFEDFQAMIRQLCNYTGEPVPPFAVLKDLLSYFDKRKDGFIDQREWLETFRRIEVPIKSEFLKHVVLNPNGAVMSNYEQSEHFDRVITSLNKNRKYIIDQLSQLEKSRGKVEFRVVKRFLEGFLRSQKIEVDNRVWKLLIGFAERDDNLVDYRYMLDRYRERTTNMQTYPILHKTQSLRGFA